MEFDAQISVISLYDTRIGVIIVYVAKFVFVVNFDAQISLRLYSKHKIVLIVL